MHFKWKYEPPTPQQEQDAKKLIEKMNISAPLALIMAKRGIKEEDARHFFHPQLTELHDPFLMKDMDKAVERLNEAMGRKERIMVYGDYDVDGCTAVALVYKFLQQYYSNIDYYIPDRYDEGYGVSRNLLWLKPAREASITSRDFAFSRTPTTIPGLTANEGIFTTFPSTTMCLWLTIWRAAARVGAIPRRNTTLSRRLSRFWSNTSPVIPSAFAAFSNILRN